MAIAPERPLAAGRRAYRAALCLYPAPFHRTYAEELEADFEEATQEALDEHGWPGVGRTWWRVYADLPISLAREWLRTPWIPILVVAATVASLVLIGTIARAQIPLRAYRARVAAHTPPPPDSPELLIMMVMMVLVPIGSLIIASAARYLSGRRARTPRRHV